MGVTGKSGIHKIRQICEGMLNKGFKKHVDESFEITNRPRTAKRQTFFAKKPKKCKEKKQENKETSDMVDRLLSRYDEIKKHGVKLTNLDQTSQEKILNQYLSSDIDTSNFNKDFLGHLNDNSEFAQNLQDNLQNINEQLNVSDEEKFYLLEQFLKQHLNFTNEE